MPWLRAAVSREWLRAEPEKQSAERVGENLDVHALPLVFFPSSRGCRRRSVDRQQRAVQDHERFRPGRFPCLGEGRCASGQDFDGLVFLPVDGCDADSVAGGKLGVAVAATQVGQGEQQGLTAGGQSSPPRTDLPPLACKLLGQVLQGTAGKIDRRQVGKHAKLLADTGEIGREPVCQELRRSVQPAPTNTTAARSG